MKSTILFSLSLLLAGCGGGSASSGIDPDETLDALGTAALDKLCEETEEALYDVYGSSYLVEAVCTAMVLEESATASECADAVQECLTDLPLDAETWVADILAQAGCGAVSVEATGCLATVGQLNDCLDALELELATLQSTMTCAAVGEPLDSDWATLELPEACQQLQTICPD